MRPLLLSSSIAEISVSTSPTEVASKSVGAVPRSEMTEQQRQRWGDGNQAEPSMEPLPLLALIDVMAKLHRLRQRGGVEVSRWGVEISEGLKNSSSGAVDGGRG